MKCSRNQLSFGHSVRCTEDPTTLPTPLSAATPTLWSPQTLTERTGGATPSRRTVALKARRHFMARAPVGTRVGGTGVLSCRTRT